MRLRLSFVCSLVFASCSESQGTVAIVTGEQTDVFSRQPAPITLVTEKVALDGTKTELSRKPLPTASIDLGTLKPDEIGGIAVTGVGADGKPLVKGESLLVQWGALQDQTLELFAQRTGELARVPSGPGVFDTSNAIIVEGRFVLGVNGTRSFIYDLLSLHTLNGAPVLPRPAKSLATVSSAILAIDENGATSFDLETGAAIPFQPPTGGTFAEIANGGRVLAPDSSQLVVGATRPVGTGGPTVRVLAVDATGVASFAALITPREAACATYVQGRGLVVYGGNAAPELLAPGASVATALPFPSDPVQRCGATALDPTHVLVAGGDGGPARVLDLTCTTACATTPWRGDLPLVRAEAEALGPDVALIVGDDAAGVTHAYRASPTELKELTLRTPRRNARLLHAPAESLILVGGNADGIEMYRE